MPDHDLRLSFCSLAGDLNDASLKIISEYLREQDPVVRFQDANRQAQVPERRLQVGAALKSRSHTVEVGMKRDLRGVP